MTAEQMRIIDAMESLGGSFVKALADAWRKGDAKNRTTLETAFPEIWIKYRGMAKGGERADF